MSLHTAVPSAGWCTGTGQAMIPSQTMAAAVYHAIRVFAREHKGCGELRGNAEPITPEGYAV